jgi:hypothetical protein
VTAKATLLSSGGRASNVRVTGGIDKITKLNRTIQKINPGGQQEVSFQYTAKFAGGRPQRVWFKASTAGCDINSQNNTVSDRSRPGERFPDLAIDRIELQQHEKMRTASRNDGTRFLGQKVSIFVAVNNLGNGDAGPFQVRIQVGRKLAGVVKLDGLKRKDAPSGSGRIAWLGYTFRKTGETKVKVTLDKLNQVKESDETNNEASYDVRILPKKPELVAFWWHNTYHSGDSHIGRKRTGVGKRTAIEGAVMNKGFRQSQPTTVSIKCEGRKKRTRTVPALKPGEIKKWKFWFRWASPVRKTCELRVDDEKKNSEYGTEWNWARLTVAVRIK